MHTASEQHDKGEAGKAVAAAGKPAERLTRWLAPLVALGLVVGPLAGCDDPAASKPAADATTTDANTADTAADTAAGIDTQGSDAAATGPVELFAGTRPPPRLSACFANPACDTPLLVAHRGEDSGAPENSLAAIAAAHDRGADVVEVDVRQTKDGVLVLMHDGDVKRTTDGETRLAGKSLSVTDLTWPELQTLVLDDPTGGCDGALADSKPQRCRVPTLAEAVQVAKGKVLLMLDFKSGDHLAVAKVVADAEALETVYFFDSALDKLAQIQAQYPGFVVMPRADDAGSTLQLLQPNWPVVHIDPGYLTDVAQAARQKGNKLFLNVFVPMDVFYKLAADGDPTALETAETGVRDLLNGGARLLQTDRVSQLRQTVDAWRASR